MSVQIVYAAEKYFSSFHETLSKVAQERIYIEMIEAPPLDSVVEFQSILRDAGINVHVRKSRGRDIDAACGQLRRKAQQELVQLGKA